MVIVAIMVALSIAMLYWLPLDCSDRSEPWSIVAEYECTSAVTQWYLHRHAAQSTLLLHTSHQGSRSQSDGPLKCSSFRLPRISRRRTSEAVRKNHLNFLPSAAPTPCRCSQQTWIPIAMTRLTIPLPALAVSHSKSETSERVACRRWRGTLSNLYRGRTPPSHVGMTSRVRCNRELATPHT